MKSLFNVNHFTRALAVAITLSVSTGGVLAHEGEHHPDAMTASLEKLKGKEFESMFLKEMIHHHESAVEMAKLAATNTKRAELNKFGKDIITAQKAEIDQMTGWLKKDGESARSMKEMPGMEKMMGEMEGLNKAKDAEFDKMFLRMMSEHHQGAVAMSKLVADRTERADIKELASKIIKDQTKEVEQMKSWEKSWFGSAAH